MKILFLIFLASLSFHSLAQRAGVGSGGGGGGKGGNGTYDIYDVLRFDYVFEENHCTSYGDIMGPRLICGLLSKRAGLLTFDQNLYFLHCCQEI